MIYRHHGYERVYMPLYKVTDAPSHIQGEELYGDTGYYACYGVLARCPEIFGVRVGIIDLIECFYDAEV